MPMITKELIEEQRKMNKYKSFIFESYGSMPVYETCNGCTQEFLDKHNLTLEEYEFMNECNTHCFNCINCVDCENCSECDGCYMCMNCYNCESCNKCSRCNSCICCNSCIRSEECKGCYNCVYDYYETYKQTLGLSEELFIRGIIL